MARFTLSVMGTTLFGLRLDPLLDALLLATKVLERQFINLATEEQFKTLMPQMEESLRDARPIREPAWGPFTFLVDKLQDAVADLTIENALTGLEKLRAWMTRGLDEPSIRIAVDILDCVAQYMISAAQSYHLENDDNLLTRLLDEQQRGVLTGQQVRNEILNVLLAGSGTTATALTALLYYVVLQPAFIPLLRAEVAEALETSGTLANPQTDVRLIFNTALFQEVLRLFPPTRQVARTATEPMVLEGVRIEPRDLLVANILGIHRKRSLWPEWTNPRRFEPSHWIGATPPQQPAFMPFGTGPHRCPGQNHAFMYSRILLATILQAYDLEFADSTPDLILMPGSTVQIGPLFVNVKRREES